MKEVCVVSTQNEFQKNIDRQVAKCRKSGKCSWAIGRGGGDKSSSTRGTIMPLGTNEWFLVRRQFTLWEANCGKTAFPFSSSPGKQKVEMIAECCSYTFFCV